jgi:uncharacterized protein (TIGR00730 family)
MKIKRVCVFCGSSTGNNGAFTEATKDLGRRLTEHNIELVFGGGSVGLMNVIANSVLTYGGKAHGVIPDHLLKREVGHKNLTALHITDTMHERKAMMAELSDAFIALPGGYGTLEELMEAITWLQLKIHKKPVILYNVDGYYDKLIEFIEHATDSGFIDGNNNTLLHSVDNLDDCMRRLGVN